MSDMVNRPAHYCEGRKYEPLKVISDWELNYRLGSALKYISRAGRKDPSRTVEDLKKAIFYLDREIEALEGTRAPYNVTYEDVLEDQAASAAAGETLALEYGVQDVDDQQLDYWESADDEWVAFWDSDDEYMWDPSLGPVEIPAEEIKEILAKKDLDRFSDDEIVSTVERRGMVIGFKKNGYSCVLRNGQCA